MGQHFLISREAAKKIITAAEISKNDAVIEVGPGTGALTKLLVNKANQVIAVEKDEKLASALKNELMRDAERLSSIKIVTEDILKFDVKKYIAKNRDYILVGDIPYYLTSRLLRKFLANEKHKPSKIILMIQREVAQRIYAQPPHMNLLALSVQVFGEPRIVAYISKKDFWPEPKVDSAILIIESISNEFFVRVRDAERLSNIKINQEKFFELLKIGFGNKRKKLLNNIAKKFGMQKSDLEVLFKKYEVPILARAQELNLEKWAYLYQSLYEK